MRLGGETLLETDTIHNADHVFVMVRRAQRGSYLRLPTVLHVSVPPNAAKKTGAASTTSGASDVAADATPPTSLPSDAGASASTSAGGPTSANTAQPPVFRGSCAKCGKNPLTELAWLCLHWYAVTESKPGQTDMKA